MAIMVGPLGPGATDMIQSLARRRVEASKDPRTGYYLRQQIDMAVQRGNAISVLGTFPGDVISADISFIT